ncbi:MAG: hypothetical protein AAFQ08_02905, partial [Bacteroidota bacterium]
MASSNPSSLWTDTLREMLRSKLTLAALVVVSMYLMVALLAYFGWLANDWNTEVGGSYEAPSWQHWMGTDIFGRSVLAKVRPIRIAIILTQNPTL